MSVSSTDLTNLALELVDDDPVRAQVYATLAITAAINETQYASEGSTAEILGRLNDTAGT